MPSSCVSSSSSSGRIGVRGRAGADPLGGRRTDRQDFKRAVRATVQARELPVLHTWGSALTHHPHVHMIAPGGGLSLDGQRWVACRPGFFLPVRVCVSFLEFYTPSRQQERIESDALAPGRPAWRSRQATGAVRYHRRRSAPASASPSRGPGNGILWAETGGRFQPQNAGERPEFGSQTATRLTNRPELRGFLPARKPRRFACTVWWWTQSRETGLRRPNFAENASLAVIVFLGGSKRRFSKRSNASVYNALADPEPIRRQQNNSQITDNSQITANAAKCA